LDGELGGGGDELGSGDAQYRGCGDIGVDDGELGNGGQGGGELGGGSELGWTMSWAVAATSWVVGWEGQAGWR
jgi:hypothetical protein